MTIQKQLSEMTKITKQNMGVGMSQNQTILPYYLRQHCHRQLEQQLLQQLEQQQRRLRRRRQQQQQQQQQQLDLLRRQRLRCQCLQMMKTCCITKAQVQVI